MSTSDFPAPKEGIVATILLIVEDVERSREFYEKVLGAKVVMDREPAVLKFHNTWIILNVGGGPTDDKPDITLVTPDGKTASVVMNLRVADIQAVYKDWSSKGATFLTPPIDRGAEIRAYIRDPDGHLIEVGQINPEAFKTFNN